MQIRPNNGDLRHALEKMTLFNARLSSPVFCVEELTNFVPAWIVQFRCTLEKFEAMNAFKEEVCVQENRRWTGFTPPKPEKVRFGRLRHLLGGVSIYFSENTKPFVRECNQEGFILAAGDEWQSFNPVMDSDTRLGLSRIDLVKIGLSPLIDEDIWWLFVEN